MAAWYWQTDERIWHTEAKTSHGADSFSYTMLSVMRQILLVLVVLVKMRKGESKRQSQKNKEKKSDLSSKTMLSAASYSGLLIFVEMIEQLKQHSYHVVMVHINCATNYVSRYALFEVIRCYLFERKGKIDVEI